MIRKKKSVEHYDWRPTVLAIALALIASLPGVIAAWRIGTVGQQVEEVHKSTNSRLTELLDVSKAHSRAEGVVEGRAYRDKEQKP